MGMTTAYISGNKKAKGRIENRPGGIKRGQALKKRKKLKEGGYVISIELHNMAPKTFGN